jgi:AcrR family transcriptional regulator
MKPEPKGTRRAEMEQLRKRSPRRGQINRSREWIFQALITLMGQYPFGDITTVMLAEKAGVSRQTIHRHFSSNEEILLWHMDHTFTGFLSSVKEGPDTLNRGTLMANSYRALSVCRNNADFLGLLKHHGLEHLFLHKMEEYAGLVSARIHRRQPTGDGRAFFREKYFAGGFFLVLMHWIDRGMDMPEEELCTLLGGLVAL